MSTAQAPHRGELQHVSPEAVEALRAEVRGAVVTPADEGYADVRRPFSAMHADRPALVIRCLLDVAERERPGAILWPHSGMLAHATARASVPDTSPPQPVPVCP